MLVELEVIGERLVRRRYCNYVLGGGHFFLNEECMRQLLNTPNNKSKRKIKYVVCIYVSVNRENQENDK